MRQGLLCPKIITVNYYLPLLPPSAGIADMSLQLMCAGGQSKVSCELDKHSTSSALVFVLVCCGLFLLLLLLFFFNFVFQVRVSLCNSSSCPLAHRDPPASAVWVLRLKARATIVRSQPYLFEMESHSVAQLVPNSLIKVDLPALDSK